MIDFEFRTERDDDPRGAETAAATDPDTAVDTAPEATGPDAAATDTAATDAPPAPGIIVEAEGAGTVFEAPVGDLAPADFTADAFAPGDFELPLPGSGFNYEFGQFY